MAGSYVPRLNISSSDAASPAVEVPGDADVQPWHDKDGRGVGRAYVASGTHIVELDDVARFSFGPGANEVIAVAAPGAAEDLIEEYFRRWILPVAVQVGGLEVLHASAVVAPRGVAGFSAVSEAGKSTLAFGLYERGYPIWTDDALAFDVSGEGPQAYPLPFRLRLRPGSAVHFGLLPQVGGTIAVEANEGAGTPEPISALFLLERTATDPPGRLEPADPLEIFPLLVEGSYHFGQEEGERKRALLSRYLELATGVPVYRLILATGLENLDPVLDLVEEKLR